MYFLTLKISFRKVYGKNPGLNELSEFSHPPLLPMFHYLNFDQTQ